MEAAILSGNINGYGLVVIDADVCVGFELDVDADV